MVFLKAIYKNTPMDVSLSGTIDQKLYLKKLRGSLAPLDPLDPPMIMHRVRYLCDVPRFDSIVAFNVLTKYIMAKVK